MLLPTVLCVWMECLYQDPGRVKCHY